MTRILAFVKMITISCTAALVICASLASSFASEQDRESKTTSSQTEIKRPLGMADGAIEQELYKKNKNYDIYAACLYIDIVTAFTIPTIDYNFMQNNKIILLEKFENNIYRYRYIGNGITIDFTHVEEYNKYLIEDIIIDGFLIKDDIRNESFIKSYILNKYIEGDLNVECESSNSILSFKEGVLLRLETHNLSNVD